MKKLILLLLFCPLSVFAEVTPAQRLAFIEQRLQADELHRDIWQWGWAGVYAVSAGANAYQWSDAEDSDERWNAGVGTVRSGLALYQQLASPYPGYGGYLAAVAPTASTAEKLQQAERVLKARAAKDAARFTWRPHIENVVANLIAGGLIAGFGDKDDGLAAFASGIISGELAIWTEPNQGEEDLAAYQAYSKGHAEKSAGQLRWAVTPYKVAISWSF